MLLEGTVKNGAIVLDQPTVLPEGTRVEVHVMKKPAAERPELLRDILLKSAGCLSDLPADFAERHDHYIHGTRKQ